MVKSVSETVSAWGVGRRYELKDQVKSFVEYVKIGEIPPPIQPGGGETRMPGFEEL